MGISRNTIENIRAHADIVTVISAYVDLKQRGNNYIAACPFPDHNESIPSFSVSGQKQIYKCFGCGRGGGVFTFLMEFLHLSFVESVKQLADQFGVKIEYDKGSGYDTNTKDILFELHEKARDHYQKQLMIDGYLTETRKLTRDTIEKFQIGYANPAEPFYNEVRGKYDDRFLTEQSGLFKDTGKAAVVDAFNARFVFPLIDSNGKVVGFGGTAPGAEPKYFNSSDTKIYNKSRFLFGLNLAKESIGKAKVAILTEGYFDVALLHQVGLTNAIAVCGSALTNEHAQILARYTKRVILFFDGDDAGRKATHTSIAPLFNAGIEVLVARPPKEMDPDELARESVKALKFCLKKAKSWFDYSIPAKIEPSDMQKYVLLLRERSDEIEDNNRRRMFLDTCADKLGVRKQVLYHERKRYTKTQTLPEVFVQFPNHVTLLAGMIANPEVEVDRRLFQRSDTLTALYEAVVEAKGDIPALFYGLEEDLARIMSQIVEIPVEDLDMNAAISTVRHGVRREYLQKLVTAISDKERAGHDVTELRKKLSRLIVQGV